MARRCGTRSSPSASRRSTPRSASTWAGTPCRRCASGAARPEHRPRLGRRGVHAGRRAGPPGPPGSAGKRRGGVGDAAPHATAWYDRGQCIQAKRHAAAGCRHSILPLRCAFTFGAAIRLDADSAAWLPGPARDWTGTAHALAFDEQGHAVRVAPAAVPWAAPEPAVAYR